MSDYDHDQYSLKEANADTQLDKTIQEIISSLNDLIHQTMTMRDDIKTLEEKLYEKKLIN